MSDKIEKAIQYNISEEPISFTKPTADRLLKLENPGDAIALYFFYYYTAKWQHTNTPHAANAYVMTGLKWSAGRLANAKRDLVTLGLVETIRTQKVGSKTFDKPMLKINFILWNKEKIKAIDPEKPYSDKSHDMAISRERRSTIIREKDSTDTLTADGSENDQWEELASFLAKIIRTKRNIAISTRKITAWAMEIKKLSTVEGFTFPRIVTVMKWYSHNYQGDHVPEAECGRSFRDKFLRLENAIKRSGYSYKGTSASSPQQPSTPLDSFTQELFDFVSSLMRDCSPATVQAFADQLKAYYDKTDAIRDPDDRNRGPLAHTTWKTFSADWLEFLREKQDSFPLRGSYDLKLSGPRWQEFIKRWEYKTDYNFTTGKHIL